jgi:hypothetical protein
MLAIKHHTPENNPKGYTRHTEHGESLKSVAPEIFSAMGETLVQVYPIKRRVL